MKDNDFENEKMRNRNSMIFLIMIVFIFIAIILFSVTQDSQENIFSNTLDVGSSNNTFKIISSSENENLEEIIKQYARNENINLEIEYAGTIEIMEKLNSGEKYDAVWASNSIWLYMLNSNIKTSNSRSTSINPVTFGITKSKAEELGFFNKEVKTQDIVDAIKDKKLKFSMSNPTQTNSGASALLGFLTTLAGNPEVLREEHLNSKELRSNLVSLFSGLERSSGSEDFLEEMFLKGDYESVITYETSIIQINKKLVSAGKEPLYIIYLSDGVSISDSPFAYINNGDNSKKETFLKLQGYILSDEGQKKLAETGRRTWYGGKNENADKTIFNPEWGIDTSKYIVPVKYPSTAVIKKALALYQTELRKPTHAVFCLDYSGSMGGDGIKQLTDAMKYILNEEEASKDLLQFSEKDKITVIPFSSNVINVWNTDNGNKTEELINNIEKELTGGATNIYDTAIEALEILDREDLEKYNLSIILMTDGNSNVGTFEGLNSKYKEIKKDIPIYGIMFGAAQEGQLNEIARLTNAKVFDGRTDLLKAFKEVRGYN